MVGALVGIVGFALLIGPVMDATRSQAVLVSYAAALGVGFFVILIPGLIGRAVGSAADAEREPTRLAAPPRGPAASPAPTRRPTVKSKTINCPSCRIVLTRTEAAAGACPVCGKPIPAELVKGD